MPGKSNRQTRRRTGCHSIVTRGADVNKIGSGRERQPSLERIGLACGADVSGLGAYVGVPRAARRIVGRAPCIDHLSGRAVSSGINDHS